MKLLHGLLLACSLCLPAAHTFAEDGGEQDPATLTVNGQAMLDIPADQVRMSAGVEATSADVDEAHAEAVASMGQLVKAMKIQKLYTKTVMELLCKLEMPLF